MESKHPEKASARTQVAWENEIRALFEEPVKVVNEHPLTVGRRKSVRSVEHDDVPIALAEMLRQHRQASHAPINWGALMSLFAAALVWGDEQDSMPAEPKRVGSARSLREGARGTLFLDGLQVGIEPESPADRTVVYASPRIVGQARRWGGLRMAREAGRVGRLNTVDVTADTAANLGTQHRAEFAARLIDDVRCYLDSNSNQLEIPLSARARPTLAATAAQPPITPKLIPPVPGRRPSDWARTGTSTSITQSLEVVMPSDGVEGPATAEGEVDRILSADERRTLLALADQLDVPPLRYPAHLTPSRLAESLTFSTARSAGRPRSGAQAPPSEIYTEPRRGEGEKLSDLVEGHPNLIVLGSPGSGKSTALIGEVVSRVRRGDPAVFLSLPDIEAAQYDLVEPSSLEEALRYLGLVASGRLGSMQENAGHITRALSRPGVLLALDGYDELSASGQRRAASILQQLRPLSMVTILSSRILGYERPAGEWAEVEVNGLSPSYAEHFLSAWFSSDDVSLERARDAIRRDGHSALASSPVLLGIVAVVAEQDDVPETVSGLYSAYISHALERRWRPVAERVRDSHTLLAKETLARALAWHMATGGSGDPTGVNWSDLVLLGEAVAALKDTDPDFVAAFLTGDALLVPYGRGAAQMRQRFRWLHRTVHEHLVGAYLVSLHRSSAESWKSVLSIILPGATIWAVPLEHMVELMTEAERRLVVEETLARTRCGAIQVSALAALCDLAAAMPEASVARQRVLDAATRAEHPGVVNLDPLGFSEIVSRRPELCGYIKFEHWRAIDAAKPEFFARFVARVVQEGILEARACIEMIQQLIYLHPRIAFDLYLALLERGHTWSLFGVYTNTSLTRQEAMAALARVGPLSRRVIPALLDTLSYLFLEVKPFVSSDGVIRKRDVDAFHFLSAEGSHGEWVSDDPETAERIAYGEYGPEYSIAIGKSWCASSSPPSTAEFALLGQTLGRLPDAPWTPPPLSRRHSLSEMHNGKLSNIDWMPGEVRKIVLFLLDPEQEKTPQELMRLWVAVSRSSLGRDPRSPQGSWILFCARDIQSFINRRLAGFVKEVLQFVLQSEPSYWGFVDGRVILPELLTRHGVEQSGLTTGQAADLLSWTLDAGPAPFIDDFGLIFRDPEEGLKEMLRRRPSILENPAVAAAFVPVLRRIGVLGRWRDQLCPE